MNPNYTREIKKDNLDLDYPPISLYEMLLRSSENIRDKIALIYEKVSFTYSEIIEASNKLAYFLKNSGIGNGDTIALYLPNSPYFIISLFAAFQIGAKITPLNIRLTINELQYQLNDAEVKVIITNKHFSDISQELFKNYAFQIKIIISENGNISEKNQNKEEEDFVLFESILKTAQLYKNVDCKSDSVALLLYTGGTTGLPKAVMLSHSNLIANAMQFNHSLDSSPRNPSTSKVIGILPFYHSFGLLCCVFSPLFKGHTIIIHAKFVPKAVWSSVEKHQITELYAVPTMYIALLQADPKSFDTSSLNFCVSGGSALPIKIIHQFSSLIGLTICEGYGLTECSPVTHINPIDDPKEGSIGKPLVDTQAKIINPETMIDVIEFDEIGELVIKGPQVMIGYLKKGLETLNVFTSDGWLRTGDLVKKDKDGYYYIVDRLKDVISSGGLKIYPREIEELVFKHPEVSLAALIGVPNDYYGEVGKLFIVKKENSNLEEKDIIEYLKDKVAKYKVPKIIKFVSKLPLSGAGKILKRELE